MPDNWFYREEAIKYFGLEDEDALEILVDEHGIDVEVDEGGRILRVDAEESKEPLFKEHAKKVGHRPDDPEIMKRVKAEKEKQEKDDKDERDARRVLLKTRIRVKKEKKVK